MTAAVCRVDGHMDERLPTTTALHLHDAAHQPLPAKAALRLTDGHPHEWLTVSALHVVGTNPDERSR